MLYVLFDAQCTVCVASAEWLHSHAQHEALKLIDARGAFANQYFNTISKRGEELVVVSDTGEVWWGPSAFLVCFWAMKSTHWLAQLASFELFQPLAEMLFRLISDHRGSLAPLLGLPDCQDGHSCSAVAHSHNPYR